MNRSWHIPNYFLFAALLLGNLAIAISTSKESVAIASAMLACYILVLLMHIYLTQFDVFFAEIHDLVDREEEEPVLVFGAVFQKVKEHIYPTRKDFKYSFAFRAIIAVLLWIGFYQLLKQQMQGVSSLLFPAFLSVATLVAPRLFMWTPVMAISTFFVAAFSSSLKLTLLSSALFLFYLVTYRLIEPSVAMAETRLRLGRVLRMGWRPVLVFSGVFMAMAYLQPDKKIEEALGTVKQRMVKRLGQVKERIRSSSAESLKAPKPLQGIGKLEGGSPANATVEGAGAAGGSEPGGAGSGRVGTVDAGRKPQNAAAGPLNKKEINDFQQVYKQMAPAERQILERKLQRIEQSLNEGASTTEIQQELNNLTGNHSELASIEAIKSQSQIKGIGEQSQASKDDPTFRSVGIQRTAKQAVKQIKESIREIEERQGTMADSKTDGAPNANQTAGKSVGAKAQGGGEAPNSVGMNDGANASARGSDFGSGTAMEREAQPRNQPQQKSKQKKQNINHREQKVEKQKNQKKILRNLNFFEKLIKGLLALGIIFIIFNLFSRKSEVEKSSQDEQQKKKKTLQTALRKIKKLQSLKHINRKDEVIQAYQTYLAVLATEGIIKLDSQTPKQFLYESNRLGNPLKPIAGDLTDYFSKSYYGERALTDEEYASFTKIKKRIRFY